jgi:CDGSH-type Zn-finger protein/mannose-6-phosphate isomerase-like protein (cupin superfamily)
MNIAVVAGYKPYYAELQAAKTYLWCACGRSAKQPFCDGSHEGTGIKPLRYVAKIGGEEVLFCLCKQTRTPPFCDGSHNNLLELYADDDPQSEANRRIPVIAAGADGKARLGGACLVCDMGRIDRLVPAPEIELADAGNYALTELVGAEDGAVHQTLYLLQLADGTGPTLSFGDSAVVLTVAAGEGAVNISGHLFDCGPQTGISVRPGETFALTARGSAGLRCFVSVSPQCPEGPQTVAIRDNFNAGYPQRSAIVDPAQRQAMAERFFQMMVDHRHGSEVLTQFIGEIPPSKAAPHRHLYEEVLMIVRGSGMMWTEAEKYPVHAGDIIFLPRKQVHSLESTSQDGMLVAGLICPGNNPAINY